MNNNSRAGSRRWVLAQRQIPGLIDDTPDALITVVLAWDTGMICGLHVGQDAASSAAAALTSEAPESDSVPDPVEIAVPAHLVVSARFALGRFAVPPRVIEINPEELLAANDILDMVVASMCGGTLLTAVDPADWFDLLSAALDYLSTEYWFERGEEPLKLWIDLDSARSTRVLSTMGEVGISTGLVVFPGVAKYRRFLDRSQMYAEVVDFPTGTIAFYADRDEERESMRQESILLGWPEDDQRTPIVVRCGDQERSRPTSPDVRLATVALVATTRYAQDRTGKGEVRLHDGTVASYKITDLE